MSTHAEFAVEHEGSGPSLVPVDDAHLRVGDLVTHRGSTHVRKVVPGPWVPVDESTGKPLKVTPDLLSRYTDAELEGSAAAASSVAHELWKQVEELSSLTTKIQKEQVRRSFPDHDQSHLHRGSWECPESPTGCCVYDTREDPSRDSCLFCGDPEERK